MSKQTKEGMINTDDKYFRIYGKNKFWCNNRIITGEKYYNLFITFFSYFIPYILSIIFILHFGSLKLYLNIIYIVISSILFILNVYSMLKCGCTDPGILPKQKLNLDKSIHKQNIKSRIDGHIMILNYCYTCNIYRPTRTSHCSRCDNCIERFDHHCLWLGNCIGKRNYKYFYMLLLCLNLNALFQIGFCIYVLIIDLKLIKNKENKGYALSIIMGCIILYNFLFIIFFIGKFLAEYTYLLIKNKTYSEYKKNKFKIYPKNLNPYKKYNLCSNRSILCIKISKSKIFDAILNFDNSDSIITNNMKTNNNIKKGKNEKGKIRKKINEEYINEKLSENSESKMKFFKTYQYNKNPFKKIFLKNGKYQKDNEQNTNENNISKSIIKEDDAINMKVNMNKNLKRLNNFKSLLRLKNNIFLDKENNYSDVSCKNKRSNNIYNFVKNRKINKKKIKKNISCETNIKANKIEFTNL